MNSKKVEIQKNLETVINNSTIPSDLLLLLSLISGALFKAFVDNLNKILKLRTDQKFTKSPPDDINFLLHKVLIDSDNDGILVCFPITEKQLFKSPTLKLKWLYKVTKPNVKFTNPPVTPRDLSTLASDKWVKIGSVFGFYLFKTIRSDGNILAYLIIYDSSKVDPKLLNETDTKHLEKLLTNIIKNNEY